ncbi:MAG: trifunctional transcriptional activator/DNA repair protein Ada/methylated-DNA--[protein]-cysteine S-methyltransferase [Acidobacteriota bacterium]
MIGSLDPFPSDDALYQALLDRDDRFDGRAFVGVTSTGVFCRLTCPARKPKRENCRFFPSAAACLEAGFRPCLRCRPLDSIAGAEPIVTRLLEALDAEPARRWSEHDLRLEGFDPSTVRRAFQRQLGMTFLALARRRRLLAGASARARGRAVIDAQLDAGFASGSGFRAAVARLLGRPPAAIDGSEALLATNLETPLGPMLAVADERHLFLLEFLDRRALPRELEVLQRQRKASVGLGLAAPAEQVGAELRAYFEGTSARFDTPIEPAGSAFACSVWERLRAIPPAATSSYGELARAIDRPTAVRAVARANGANRLAILIPCHRVVGADGSLTGYGGGLWRKRWLIDHEAAHFSGASAAAAEADSCSRCGCRGTSGPSD